MPKVSVIVPVYNTEKYIKKCLDSIYNQTMKDLEIIVVNDGSQDNSETIIKQWIEQHKNEIAIKYIKKGNGGLSDARNYGVKQATGKYLSFVDSDDYLDPNLYQSMETYIQQGVDLIKFKMTTVDEQGEIIEKLDGPVFERCTGEEAFKKLCTKDTFLEVACIYLYRREFYEKQSFKYEVGVYHEDFDLTPWILIHAKSVVCVDSSGYYYLQRENSITSIESNQKEQKKVYDVLQHYDKAMKRIQQVEVTNHTKMLWRRYYTNSLLLKVEQLQGSQQEKFIQEIKKRKVYQNIKAKNVKQLVKKILVRINIKWYLKMR